jgi:3-deoxy-D-manno-octulosonate 8-phosphate phosphatase (KDO 8-P phosphatase)
MPALSPKERQARLKRVKLVLMDIDGVLTNGLIYHFVNTDGALVEFKGVNAQDSIALSWLPGYGVKTGFISGRNSLGMQERLKMLHASYIYQGRLDKLDVFREILGKEGLEPNQALYMGDDLPDIPVIKACGVGVAVANARPEVKKAAGWLTKARGGEAAVREVVETVLAAQGVWAGHLRKFGAA